MSLPSTITVIDAYGDPVTVYTPQGPLYGDSTWSAQGGTGNALLTNSPVQVATGAHALKGWDFTNTGVSGVAWVQVFDLAASGVVLGTTVPKLSRWVLPGGTLEQQFSPEGIAFYNAITLAATTTPNGSGVPAVGLNANLSYL